VPRLDVPMLAVLTLVATLALPTAAQDAYGPWEVRRGRTTDAATAGGYPTWTVTFSGPEDAPAVRIEGDEGGAVRGTILIGRRVTADEGKLPSLDFAYTTHCEDANRCGGIELVVLDAEAWDELPTDPKTERIFDAREREVCLGSSQVRSFVGDDVAEPVSLDDGDRGSLIPFVQRLRGREVVLAIAWTGLHGSKEHAELKGVKLVETEPVDATKALFERLDLERPELAAVKVAVGDGDLEQAAAAMVAHFRTRKQPVYPGDPRLPEKHELSSGQRAEADAALENRFTGQPKYGLQKVPDDLDWSFNPTKDPEWTWQFNRHSAWRALGDAYLATRDEKYAEKWVGLMRDWVAENPPGTRWSWRTLEAGIRAQGWLPVYFSFVESPSFPPLDQALFLSSVADHAEYLLPESRFHSGSNWGQTESLGLLHLGSFFPEFRDAETWRDTAWKRLEAEMFRQVLEDGAQVELTTSYHQGCISGFIRAAEIAQAGGTEPSPEYWQRLEKMYEYTLFCQKPDGTQPMLGDSWPGNTRSIVRAGAERFDRADMLWVASQGSEGTAPDYLDTQLPNAGYYVFRTDWNDPQALYLLTDVAHRWGGGHQQPDALQLNLYAFGKTLLPDSGSYLYYGPERARFARTSSHSTVTVDDANQNTSPAELHSFFSSDALSFVDGSHNGYEGVTHRRQVLFARPDQGAPPYFVVIDRVTGEGEHTADQYFHFLPAPLALNADAFEAHTQLPGGPNLSVLAIRTEGVTLEEVASEVSFVYTQKEPRPAVRFRQQGELPMTFVTLLVPCQGDSQPDLAATVVGQAAADGTVLVEVKGAGFREVVFAADQPTEVDVPEVKGTARAGLVRYDAQGKPTQVVVVGE